LITSLGLCFAFAMIAERAGYTAVLGAFLAGCLVAESARGAEVEKLIEPVRHVFGAIFFVSVGMLINPQLLASHWLVLAVRTVVAVTGKLVSVSCASLLVGEPPKGAVKTGPNICSSLPELRRTPPRAMIFGPARLKCSNIASRNPC